MFFFCYKGNIFKSCNIECPLYSADGGAHSVGFQIAAMKVTPVGIKCLCIPWGQKQNIPLCIA